MEVVCWIVQKNVSKTVKMNVEIFYVVFFCMSDNIILEYWKVERYGPNRNQGLFLFV